MRTELRNEVLRVLEGLSKGEITTMHMGDSKLTFEAISLLKEHRALKEESTSSYRITLSGYDYYQQLKAPRVYWLKQNWFPVGVLFVSSVAPVVSSLMVIWLR